ncbi:MAG: hypothetical protein K8T89_14670 [Planctomycetes bacterium]|nr:hypothetical protein [Planctomycetota bacterium]
MVAILVAASLIGTAWLDEGIAPDRVAEVIIHGNKWTADFPIRDCLELYPGQVLPDDVTLLQSEMRLATRFQDRFDLISERPTLKVLPRQGVSRFRQIEVQFPEKGPKYIPVKLTAPERSGPIATYQAYIEAIRKGDLEAAKKCWLVDDNSSSVLDVTIGMWISLRQLNQVAVEKLGEKGTEAIPDGWRREDFSDRALNITKVRVAEARVEIQGETAELWIRWMHGDSPAFMYGGNLKFREVDGKWKIDPNIDFKTSKFFKPGGWGPTFRDQIAVMRETVDGINRERLNTPKQMSAFIAEKMAAVISKYNE